MKPLSILLMLATTLGFGQELPSDLWTQTGIASWYGKRHQGRRMANKQRFNMHNLTAAHKTLQLGSRIKVTALTTGVTLTLTVTDRGPFIRRRILDVSYKAAKLLGILKAPSLVRIELEEASTVERFDETNTADKVRPEAHEGLRDEVSKGVNP